MSETRPGRKLLGSDDGITTVLTSLCLSLVTAALWSAPALAQSAGEADPWAGVEEMLVTGSDSAGILDLGKGDSVIAFDNSQLEGIGAQDIADLAAFTPNLEIRSPGSGAQATFFVRGVGLQDFSANAAGSIVIYQDDVPIHLPATGLRPIFDVDSVSVLRGPEGGTRLKNATAGAIKVTSRKPTGNLSAFMKGTYGTYNLRVFEGALEVPILDDLLSTRFAFQTTDREGWTRNGCANAPPAAARPVRVRRSDDVSFCGEAVRVRRDSDLPANLPRDVNDEHNWSLRGMLRFQPVILDTETDWLLIVHGARRDQLFASGQSFGTDGVIPSVADGSTNDVSVSLQNRLGGGAGTVDLYTDPDVIALENRIRAGFPLSNFSSSPRPRLSQDGAVFPILARRLARDLDLDPFRGDYNRPGRLKKENWGASLRGEFELENGIEIMTLTAFEQYQRSQNADNDFTPLILFEQINNDDTWQATQEIHVQREFDDWLTLEAGGLLLRDVLDAEINQLIPAGTQTVGVIDAPQINLRRRYSQKTWNAGLFARAQWSPVELFKIDVGLRYNWVKKNFAYSFVEGTTDRTVLTSNDWDHLTYHARFFYDPTEDVQFYAKFTRGWRSGHFNATANQISGVNSAKPEKLNSWEVGFSTSWLDGRLDINGAGFYYRYQDLQVFVTNRDFGSVPEQIIRNAKDAENYGIELDVIARPVEGWRIEAHFGWLESEFLDFVNQRLVQEVVSLAPVVVINQQLNEDFSGNRLPNSPQFAVSLSTTYDIDMGRFGTLTPGYFASWTDDVNFDQTEGRGLPNDQRQIFLPQHTLGQKALWIHNVRLGYTTENGQFELGVWGRNITNEAYKLFAFQSQDFVSAFIGDPRTYGVDLRVSF